jgi:hypothetical protein
MDQKSKRKTGGGIRVSVSCLADFITSYGRSAESRLRPFKFNKRGEGFARAVYYQHAIATIRSYHSNENDPAIFERALLELRTRGDKATEDRERTKFEHNARAIEAYRKLYAQRKFRILSNRRLEYRIGGIVITAQADLWAEESGTQVLLKIGVAKHNRSYVDLLLALLRKAAVGSGHKIRAKNIVYLNVSTGKEMICSGPLTRFNRTFAAATKEIAEVWPTITPPTTGTPGQGEARV